MEREGLRQESRMIQQTSRVQVRLRSASWESFVGILKVAFQHSGMHAKGLKVNTSQSILMVSLLEAQDWSITQRIHEVFAGSNLNKKHSCHTEVLLDFDIYERATTTRQHRSTSVNSRR